MFFPFCVVTRDSYKYLILCDLHFVTKFFGLIAIGGSSHIGGSCNFWLNDSFLQLETCIAAGSTKTEINSLIFLFGKFSCKFMFSFFRKIYIILSFYGKLKMDFFLFLKMPVCCFNSNILLLEAEWYHRLQVNCCLGNWAIIFALFLHLFFFCVSA